MLDDGGIGVADPPEGKVAATDGEPDADELARRRAARSLSDRTEDPEDDVQIELPLNLPGARPAKGSFRNVRKIALEGKLIGSAVKQLGGEITDPDQIIELRVMARLDHNKEVPVRDSSDETGHTESMVKRQVFRPIKIEVLNGAMSALEAAEG